MIVVVSGSPDEKKVTSLFFMSDSYFIQQRQESEHWIPWQVFSPLKQSISKLSIPFKTASMSVFTVCVWSKKENASQFWLVYAIYWRLAETTAPAYNLKDHLI